MTAMIPTDVTHVTANDLCQVITQYARADDRSLQVEIGPSEIGGLCERKLALALLGSERPNISRDEWTAAVGTACHKYVEGAFRHHNDVLMAAGKPPRWLVEVEVEIRPGLHGHVDLYDLVTNTVIDHKFPGVTAIRKYKSAKDPRTGFTGFPGQQYQWQAHLYGMGFAKLGLPVNQVRLCMYPRSGLLRDTWSWGEDYDENIAKTALARVDNLLVGANYSEGLDMLPQFFDSLDRDTTHCDWCPYFDRMNTDPTNGCKGPFYDGDYSPGKHDMTVPGLI